MMLTFHDQIWLGMPSLAAAEVMEAWVHADPFREWPGKWSSKAMRHLTPWGCCY